MTFRNKLTICMTIIITIMYGLGGALLITLSFKSAVDTEEENVINNYRSLCSTLIMANSISTQSTVEDIADILSELNSQHTDWAAVRLYNEDDTFFTSNSNQLELNNELSDICTEDNCVMAAINCEDKYYKQITGCFYVGDGLVFLDLVGDISTPYTSRAIQMKYYHFLFGALVVVSVAMSFVISHFLTKPMRYLSKVSKKIAAGSYEIRADIHSGDEMETLSEDFNTMAESLTGKIDELEEAMLRQERFVGSFAHEMKTPMTSMIGYADLLRSVEMSETERRECAEYIFKEGKRLESLSLKLLDLLVLKKQDFELKEVSPARLLRETAVIINERLKQGNVLLRFQTQKGKCFLEPDLVKSLLLNLMDNSIKAFDDGGEIIVKQTMIKGGCRFEIIDNGRGIPKQDLDSISEAFYRVDKSRSRKQGGAGLGLALCDEIVKLHNGAMEYYSVVGKGTKVVVELKGKMYEEGSKDNN